MQSIHLRTLRERRRLTQAQLKSRSGVAQNTISKLESIPGIRPAYQTLLALSDALQVDPRRLRFGPTPGTRRVRRKRAAKRVAA
jgi:transcriptional regulator with XRE-family HTH domain